MIARLTLPTFLAAACVVSAAPAVDVSKLPPPVDRAVDFARDVQPIFETHCGKCHGAEKQKGGYRLDQKQAALSGGDSFAPNIIPGKSAESPLIHFVAGLDSEMKMPSKGKPLTAEEVGILRAWIDRGATWPGGGAVTAERPHWSFQPVRRPDVPKPPGVAHPIDAFIVEKLIAKGLSLSPEADRRTLIRRLSFDLLGLPPKPEDVAAFVADPDPRAYEKLVDRYLASPQYGERWARHWLDVVRFAESDGFETNQPRPNAWYYRDYVIKALNDDMPYDQFVREQIAGDAFGSDAATGFLVGGPFDRVKSPDPVLTAQQRADELHDIVGTTASAFLGLTVNCARCHNHKFDPIPQADYFAIKAVFAGVRHGERPLRSMDDEKSKQRLAEMRRELASIQTELRGFEPFAELSGMPKRLRAPVTRDLNVDRFVPIEAKFLRFTIRETTGAEPCIDELEVFSVEGVNVALASAGTKASASGTYASNPSHKLEHINDGRFGNERSWISNESGRGWVQLEFPRVERLERIQWSRDRSPAPRYSDRLARAYEVEVSLDGGQWVRVASGSDREKVPMKGGEEEHYFTRDAADVARVKALVARRRELLSEVRKREKGAMVYAGVLGNPEETRRHHRGDPMQPKEVIAPGALTALGGTWKLAANTPEQERRIALAKWIAAPENPLTARVMANRVWHYHFGTGLVDTPSDFGRNGGTPTHPELLDWLASELVAQGWRLKPLHRVILLSATYRQSGALREDGQRVDAGARYLWRFPVRRLEAEPLRDSILAVSNVLDPRMGGPGFDLFEANTNYVKVYATKTKFGPEEYRRMIYQSKPRVELDTLFGAFDCPDAGQIAPRRTSSTTPLQALNLLNSEFLIQQSALFAERLQREAGADPAAQAQRGFAVALGRAAATEELQAATRLIAAHGLPAFCRALYNTNEFITLP